MIRVGYKKTTNHAKARLQLGGTGFLHNFTPQQNTA